MSSYGCWSWGGRFRGGRGPPPPRARRPALRRQPGPRRSRRWTTLGTPKGTRHCQLRSLTAMSRFDIHRVARHLTHHHRWVMSTVQIAIFAAAGVLAFLLRFDLTVPAHYRPQLLVALCVFVPAKIFAFYFFKMDRGWWRYASIRDVVRLAAANLVGSLLGCVILPWFTPQGRSEERRVGKECR